MTLTVRNARIHLIDKGEGEPVLFLHGNPDSSEMWSGIIAKLSPHYRCLAPDLPGFGHSGVPADLDCSLMGMAQFVDDMMEATGVGQPVHLVVHDFGGPYGLAWAVRHPHKVRSITAMNTVFFSDYEWHGLAKILRMPVVGELLQMITNRYGFVRELRRGSRKLTLEQINRTYDLVTPLMKRTVLRMYRELDPKDYAPWEGALKNLMKSIPSLVMWGDCDPYASSAFAERFGAQRVEHFADCGHWLPAEAADEVAQRLLALFAQARQSAPGDRKAG